MIAKRLLVHKCIYSTKNGIDRDGNAVYAETELQKVRLTPVLATAKTSEGESKDDKLTLYYDPTTSTPNITLKELDCVFWQDQKYTIRAITPCYTKDSDEVHHYEVALV